MILLSLSKDLDLVSLWTLFSGTQNELSLCIKSLKSHIFSHLMERINRFLFTLKTGPVGAISVWTLLYWWHKAWRESVCVCERIQAHICVFVSPCPLLRPRVLSGFSRWPRKGPQNDFLAAPQIFLPGPDPHLDQLESICYCKYKFGNL